MLRVCQGPTGTLPKCSQVSEYKTPDQDKIGRPQTELHSMSRFHTVCSADICRPAVDMAITTRPLSLSTSAPLTCAHESRVAVVIRSPIKPMSRQIASWRMSAAAEG